MELWSVGVVEVAELRFRHLSLGGSCGHRQVLVLNYFYFIKIIFDIKFKIYIIFISIK